VGLMGLWVGLLVREVVGRRNEGCSEEGDLVGGGWRLAKNREREWSEWMEGGEVVVT
jgi:hypothetical protein